MGNERLGLIGWLVAFAIVVVAFAIGFVWLPSLQENAKGASWFDAICRAVGIARPVAAGSNAGSYGAVPSTVVWNRETLRSAGSGDAQRGEVLALGCASCHGPLGVSPSQAFPNLAGLSAADLYKALEDYRDGKRQNPTMQGIAGALDGQKTADLSAYYASLPSRARNVADVPLLVAVGSPIRSIAPCSACHGPVGRKSGAPSLEGQKREYLKAQLDAFAGETRRNDINQQMRQIARALSPSERDSVAEWYANQHPE